MAWLTGWTHRKSVTLSRALGAATNYQMKVRAFFDFVPYCNMSSTSATIAGNPTERHNFQPAHASNIVEVNKTIDGQSRKYVAYDCSPTDTSEIRLYYSDDLDGAWTPYSANPIMATGNYRLPSVAFDGTTFHMLVENNTNLRIDRYTSTDGINFSFVESMNIDSPTVYMSPFIWQDPNDSMWYLYHQLWDADYTQRQLLVRSSVTIAGLKTASDSVITSAGIYATIPSVMYWQGKYWLIVENSHMGQGAIYGIYALYSNSPTSGFKLCSNSPIDARVDEACPTHVVSPDGNKAYLFTTKRIGGVWYEITREVYSTIPSLASNEVDLNGVCNSDFSDLRFTTSDGETLLDYKEEYIYPGQFADIQVEFNSIGTGATTFYTYYSKGDATSVGNGPNTFITYDDFERGNNGDAVGGGWTVVQGSALISTAQDMGDIYGYSGTRSVKLVGGATAPAITIPMAAEDGLNSVDFWLYKEDAAAVAFSLGNGTNRIHFQFDASENIQYYDGSWHDTGVDCVKDAWGFVEVKNINFTSGTYDIYYNGSLAASGAAMRVNSSYNGTWLFYGDTTADKDTFIDDFRIRNWRSVEPAWGSWGIENTWYEDSLTLAPVAGIGNGSQDQFNSNFSLGAVSAISESSALSFLSMVALNAQAINSQSMTSICQDVLSLGAISSLDTSAILQAIDNLNLSGKAELTPSVMMELFSSLGLNSSSLLLFLGSKVYLDMVTLSASAKIDVCDFIKRVVFEYEKLKLEVPSEGSEGSFCYDKTKSGNPSLGVEGDFRYKKVN